MKSKRIATLMMATVFVGTSCFGTLGIKAESPSEKVEEVIETTQMVNPYLPLWEHIPDGEPRVFEDPDNPGKYRVYIYGSHDSQKNSTYCGYEHVVWSAPVEDLSKWRYEGESYNCGGLLYAPDVVEKDGKYYLYTYDLSHGNSVAVSDRPAGPFKNMGANGEHKGSGIGADPAILVDDDGKMYAYWGYQTYYQAEIDPNTMAVKPGTTSSGDISSCNEEGEFQFYEGASIRKVDGKYVMVYCQKPDKDPENGVIHDNYRARLAYAYSDNPLGPWKYGGTIIDNGGELLNNGKMSYYDGNVHGGIMEIQDQWYVFYHRMTNQSEFSRQAMMEPIEVSVEPALNGKVLIKQAEMTSQGAAVNGLDAYRHYDAGIACYLTEGAYITTDYSQTSGYNPITNLKDGCVVGYKYVNFGDGAGEDEILQLALDIKAKGAAGTMDIYIDDPNNGTRKTDGTGRKIGSIDIAAGGTQNYYVEKTTVENVSGKHAIFFVFNSADKANEICEINGFQFSREKTIFRDTFEKTLGQWNMSGTPSVNGGILNLAAKDMVVSKDGAKWNDYLTELKGVEGDISLDFYRSDERNYYTTQLSGNRVTLSVTRNGVTRQLKSVEVQRTEGKPVKFSVSCVRGQIAVRINGAPVLVTTNHFFGQGKIALRSESVAKADEVIVTAAEKDMAMRSDKIFVNGRLLSGFEQGTKHYTMAIKEGEKIPAVTASSTDEDVHISIKQAKEIPGAAVVKFADYETTKTYVIEFYQEKIQEHDFTKGKLPKGWSIVNPKDVDANVTYSDEGVTITSAGTDLAGTENQLQLDEPLQGDYQLDAHIKLSEPLHQNWAKYGMTIYKDDKNMVIMDHEHDNRGKVQILWWKDGTWVENKVSQNYAGSEIYFRLIKIGNNFECQWSSDGENYVSVYTAETDGRFEEALLHLFVSKQQAGNEDFTATFDKVKITELAPKIEVPTENSELVNLSLRIGERMVVPFETYENSSKIVEKAQEILNTREDVKKLGAEVRVEESENGTVLKLMKDEESVITEPLRIEMERSSAELKELIDKAKKIREEECTAASWDRLVYAIGFASYTEENIQATPYEIAEAYDVLKVTIEGLEKVEKTLYTITIENGSIRGGSSTGEYEAGTVLEIEADRADSGMVFDRWVSEDVEFTDKFAVNTTITMPDKNVTIKARYKAKSNLGEDEQGETGNHNQNKRPSVPKTGDFTFPAVWGMAEILSISIIVITVIRKKRLNK